MTKNYILRTDSYNASHYLQLPPGVQHMYNYTESRGGRWDHTVFFGAQAYVDEYLLRPITRHDIEEAEEVLVPHGLPFNRDGWMHILNKHGGYMPLTVMAPPEGLLIGTHNALVTVVNTDPLVPWLSSYGECNLLRGIWYPTTVATNSFHCKLIIAEAMAKSSDTPLDLDFKLHDFGARGATSGESAALGGMAHLVNFKGTDTLEAIMAARAFYGETMAGHSIPAAAHLTITAWGQEREADAYRNMIRVFGKPGGIFAAVSDSYDLFNAVNALWGGSLKQAVIDSGAIVVIRPDSGDPTIIPVQTIQALAEKFGYTVNSRGYKMLPWYIRVIQGDGINEGTIRIILGNLLAAGFSADNLAFGMGGALLQQIDRDTQRFAEKTSSVSIDGQWFDAFKAPVTDPGKRSKRGRLALVQEGDGYATVPLLGNEERNIMQPIYHNGPVTRRQSFAEIRERATAAALRIAA